MESSDRAQVFIHGEGDIVAARQRGRELAARTGFSSTEQTLIATAISELARNIVVYAGHGELTVCRLDDGARCGIEVVARDDGPGIADVALAMRDGYSTAKSLGLGLPGARRLMHDFELTSELGKGTTVVMRRWLR